MCVETYMCGSTCAKTITFENQIKPDLCFAAPTQFTLSDGHGLCSTGRALSLAPGDIIDVSVMITSPVSVEGCGMGWINGFYMEGLWAGVQSLSPWSYQ